ncbi:hypothetical protein NQ315_014804 [Exocentrus adspersus]|uniref:YqaJ viral recombinase domain-containing protein n=1 Tax=Exocentrus adspersus TaxID=1586481 RepID=A0AAV8VN85_9CUCU|nr:hypothetical protein NQ315_014804 [Exocentrus adspersus]
MHRIGLAEDAECRLCMEDDETAEHVLCTCPAADRTRFSILGKVQLMPEDLDKYSPGKIIDFLKGGWNCWAKVNVYELEPISKTDIKCAWATEKLITKENYKPVPVKEMPCFSNKVRKATVTVHKNATFTTFLNNLPNSALSQHNKGRRSFTLESSSGSNNNSHLATALMNNACQSVVMLELSAESITFHSPCCKQLYYELFEQTDTDSCIKTNQHSNLYHKERKYRVTGSRIYELFTYSRENWELKSVKYFWPSNVNNKYTRYGLTFEKEARCEFVARTGMQVHEFGLMISDCNKWLGYSPDGVIYENEQPMALLEIKCIFAGATSTVGEALKTIKYLEYKNGKLCLRKRHKYYGQIQSGMAVLNLNKCFFRFICFI